MSFVCTQFKYQTVLFNSEIGPYQELPLWVSGPGSDGNEEVLQILQNSSITGSDCLRSYQDNHWWGYTPLRCSLCIPISLLKTMSELCKRKTFHSYYRLLVKEKSVTAKRIKIETCSKRNLPNRHLHQQQRSNHLSKLKSSTIKLLQ